MAHRRGAVFLLIVVFAWGLSWPVNKTLLSSLSPLWMIASRSAVATVALFAISPCTGRLVWPPRADLPVLLSITLLHMVGFAALAALGLQLVSTGRSVVLAYTTPLWVMPGAWLLLDERLTRRRILGVALGLLGLVALFNPIAFDWSDRNAVFGNFALLVAAFLWAASILHIRGHRWRSTPFGLLPWEALLATAILTIMASVLETEAPTAWNADLALLLLFAGIVGTAIPHWAVVMASRDLPAVTTSLGLLAAPLISISAATLALGEIPTWSLLVAIPLILGGVAIGALDQVPGRHPKAEISSKSRR